MADKRNYVNDKSRLAWLDPYRGGKYLDEIDRDLIDHIKAERIKIASKSTANRYLSLIRRVLRRAAFEWEWIDRVPRIQLFRESSGRVRSLTQDELSRLLRELPEHLADMALFAVSTGLRAGNVRLLQWSQIDLKLRHAWIGADQHKNGRPHAVPLNDTAMAVLTKRQGIDPLYVFTYEGKPVGKVSTRAWRNALKRAGIKNFRFHDLRHTWATWMRRAGVPTHSLQRLGGWKTSAMVERYAHIAPEGLQSDAARLDNVLGYTVATLEPPRNGP
jgi:integrase